MEKGTVSDISVSYNITIISIGNTDLSKINEITASLSDINIDMIAMTHLYKDSSSLVISLNDNDAAAAVAKINSVVPAMCSISSDNAKISVYGNGFKNPLSGTSLILDKIIESGAEIKLFSTSDTEFSVIVDNSYVDDVLKFFK